MRDLLLLAVCCCLAAGFWLSSGRRVTEQASAREVELYQLGAPQTMKGSPERSLLLGDFALALRAHPSLETYRRLAPLYLVSADLKGRTVSAFAFHDQGMGRVVGKALEFFDSQGRPVRANLSSLGKSVAPLSKSFSLAANPTLLADGPWLLYHDAKRWAVFRWSGTTLNGYVSGSKLAVDGDAIVLAGKSAWVWSAEGLQPSK